MVVKKLSVAGLVFILGIALVASGSMSVSTHNHIVVERSKDCPW